jgi:hypothetical protein
LVSGFWFLVFGFWFLVSGFWFLVFGKDVTQKNPTISQRGRFQKLETRNQKPTHIRHSRADTFHPYAGIGGKIRFWFLVFGFW